MKKILLVGALALSSLFASAQDGLQGVWFAGGNLTLSSNKDKSTGTELKTDEYTVKPLLGKFITPSVAVGGALGYSHSKNEKLNEKNNTFTIQPLVRKYWNIAGGLYFFGQAALPVSFGSNKYVNKVGDSDGKVNEFGMHLQVSPGFDYIVNSWFTVEASFQLVNAGFSRTKPKGGDASTNWGLNGNTLNSTDFGDITVGVKFLF